MLKTIISWSGGKDSAYMLHQVIKSQKFDVKYLLSNISETYKRISMHGVQEKLLVQQCEALSIPLKKIYLPTNTNMAMYDQIVENTLTSLKDIKTIHFGDIFLEDIRSYREKAMKKIGWSALFPIWHINTKTIVKHFIQLGYKAIIVCVNATYLDHSYLGVNIDDHFLSNLPPNVDPCGENGEFHSFVYDGPLFKKKIEFQKKGMVTKIYDSGGDHHGNKKIKKNNSHNAKFHFLEITPINES